jgi:hypothetical protein
MSGEKEKSNVAAPVVPARVDPDEGPYLRALVGEKEGEAEEKGGPQAGSDEGSELSSAPVSEDEEESDSGRPKFRRASLGPQREENTQEFFGRGRNRRMNNNGDGIFDTPKSEGHRGALGRALAAASGNSQEGGTVWTLRLEAGKEGGSANEMDRGASETVGEEMDVVEEDEWMRERANESEEERSLTPPRFRSPTPSQKRTPAPRPVTPTRGRKRMAIGTPVPARKYGPPPLGAFSLSSLELVEARLNSKLASLQMDAEAREKRLNE